MPVNIERTLIYENPKHERKVIRQDEIASPVQAPHHMALVAAVSLVNGPVRPGQIDELVPTRCAPEYSRASTKSHRWSARYGPGCPGKNHAQARPCLARILLCRLSNRSHTGAAPIIC